MSVNVVPLLEDLLGLLQTLNETKGVPEGQGLSEKNILQNDSSDPNKKTKADLSSPEKRRTMEVATIFAKTFLEFQKKTKKDTALKTSVQKTVPNFSRVAKVNATEPKKSGSMLGGILALLGGAGALIMGLLTDGPFKGALKLLSKLGISGGVKMLMAAAKGLLGTFSKFVAAPFKFAGKLLGKGFMGKLFKALKPLGKIFKRIPIIGTLISIGFAISRFNSGQNVRGVIDVLSGVVGLVDLVAPGVGTVLSLGLDMLNMWMDSKMNDPKNAGRSEMDILGDIGKTIGNWIWDNALWLPVIGGFKRWGMAYDAFKGGNIMEGLKQLGLGLLSFGGMGPIIMGIEALMGFFSSNTQEQTDLKPNTSWLKGMKKWIKGKMEYLPWHLRKPLEWFGILDDTDNTDMNIPTPDSGGVMQKISGWFSGIFDFIKPSVDSVKDWFSGLFGLIKENFSMEKISGWFSGLFGLIKDFFQGEFAINIIENIKSMGTSVMSMITDIFNTLKSVIGTAIDFVKNINLFGGNEEDEVLRNAKAMGWNNVEDYEKSGWKANPNRSNVEVAANQSKVEVIKDKNTVEVVDEKRKDYVDALVLIGKEQIKILSDIRNIGIQTYKVLANNSGSSPNPIVIQSGGSSNTPKKSSQVSLNTSRGDYGSSPYAFA